MNKGPFAYQQMETKLKQTLTTTTTTTEFTPKNLLSKYQPHDAILSIKIDEIIESNSTQSNNSFYKSVQHIFGYNAMETPEIFRSKKVKHQKRKKKRNKKNRKSVEPPPPLIQL